MEETLNSMVDSISGGMEIFTQTDNLGAIASAAQGIYSNVAEPIAAVLICIFFILALLDSVTRETFTFDQFIKQLITLILAISIVNNGSTLIFGANGLINLGDGIVAQIESYTVSGGSTSEAVSDTTSTSTTDTTDTTDSSSSSALKEKIKDLSFFEQLAMWGRLIIPYALSTIMGLLAQIVCYSRLIEIYVLGAFAPIALADIFKSGMQSNGMRFVKEMFALGLQGGIMLIIKLFYGILATDVVTFDNVFFTLVVGFSACALLMKSQSVARKIVGV